MRILHCLSQIPGRTGSGVYLQSIVREAAAKGFEQAVICGLPTTMGVVESQLEVTPENIFPLYFDTPELPFPVAGMSDVMPYPSSRFSNFTPQQFEQYETAFSKIIKQAVNRFNPEIIHTHHLWIMTALVKKLFPNIPVVTSVHGTELRQLQLAPELADYVVQGVVAVNKVIVLNQDQRRQVIKAFKMPALKVTVTGTGYRQDLFCRDFCSKEDIPTIIYAGKLSRAKGVFWLLKAFARIRSDSALWLAGSGDGPEAEEINIAAENDKRVSFLGALSQKELANRFQRAHIMVLPSFYEGLPLVLLEALACNCRVIVTDLPGIRELVSEEAVTEGLVYCISKPPLIGPDTLEKEHEKPFIDNLESALKKQIKMVKEQQFICCHNLQKTLDETGWHKIFMRIKKVYEEVTAKDKP